jgi:hypothetical protein
MDLLTARHYPQLSSRNILLTIEQAKVIQHSPSNHQNLIPDRVDQSNTRQYFCVPNDEYKIEEFPIPSHEHGGLAMINVSNPETIKLYPEQSHFELAHVAPKAPIIVLLTWPTFDGMLGEINWLYAYHEIYITGHVGAPIEMFLLLPMELTVIMSTAGVNSMGHPIVGLRVWDPSISPNGFQEERTKIYLNACSMNEPQFIPFASYDGNPILRTFHQFAELPSEIRTMVVKHDLQLPNPLCIRKSWVPHLSQPGGLELHLGLSDPNTIERIKKSKIWEVSKKVKLAFEDAVGAIPLDAKNILHAAYYLTDSSAFRKLVENITTIHVKELHFHNIHDAFGRLGEHPKVNRIIVLANNSYIQNLMEKGSSREEACISTATRLTRVARPLLKLFRRAKPLEAIVIQDALPNAKPIVLRDGRIHPPLSSAGHRAVKDAILKEHPVHFNSPRSRSSEAKAVRKRIMAVKHPGREMKRTERKIKRSQPEDTDNGPATKKPRTGKGEAETAVPSLFGGQ